MRTERFLCGFIRKQYGKVIQLASDWSFVLNNTLGTKPCLLKIQLECQSVLNNNRSARKTRFDCNKWNINETIRNEESSYLSSKFPGRRFKFNGSFYLCLAKVRVVCMLIRPFWNKGDHSNPGGSDKIYFTLSTYVLCIWDYSLSRGHVSELLLINDHWIKKLKIKSLTNGKNERAWLELSLKRFYLNRLFSLGFHWLI